MNQAPPPQHNPNAEHPIEVESTPGFADRLDAALEQAADLKGTISPENPSGFYAHAVYHDPRRPADIQTVNIPPTVRRGDTADRQRIIDYASAYVTAYRTGNTLEAALSYTNIKPGDFGTITDQVLSRLPQLMKYKAGDHSFGQSVARTMARQMLELPPGQSQQAVAQVIDRCQRIKEETADNSKVCELVDEYMSKITGPLENIVTAHNLPPGAEEYKKASRSPNYGPNAADAMAMLDEAGMVDIKFWRRLTRIPLTNMPMPVVNLLADKLESAGAGDVLEPLDGSDRAALLERSVAGALSYAAKQPGRDRSQVEGLRKLIAYKGREDTVSLANMVKYANIIIRNNYEDEITPLRPDSSFTDSAQALAVLLRFTEPVASGGDSEQDLRLARQDPAVFVRIMNAVIENGKSRQEPVIQTVGDVALRYADATPEELAALGKELEFGLPSIDAMRRQQRPSARRDAIHRPGYGKLS